MTATYQVLVHDQRLGERGYPVTSDTLTAVHLDALGVHAATTGGDPADVTQVDILRVDIWPRPPVHGAWTPTAAEEPSRA